MSVYVDDMRAPFGRMIMCHMVADSTDELLAMASAIGVQHKWLQYPGVPHCEHFDISLTKRALAIKSGAVSVTRRELAQIRQRQRDDASGSNRHHVVGVFDRWTVIASISYDVFTDHQQIGHDIREIFTAARESYTFPLQSQSYGMIE